MNGLYQRKSPFKTEPEPGQQRGSIHTNEGNSYLFSKALQTKKTLIVPTVRLKENLTEAANAGRYPLSPGLNRNSQSNDSGSATTGTVRTRQPGASPDCTSLIQELEASLRRKNWDGRQKPWIQMAGLLRNTECNAAERSRYLEICETQIKSLYKEEAVQFVCQ